MTASYPGSFPSFTVKTDLVDTIHAGDVDSLQDEVLSVENTIGLQPHISTSPNPATGFNAVSTTYASLAARLANIENGIVGDSHTQYLKSTGGAVATTAANNVVPLTVQAKSGQTADVFDVTSPASAVYFKVDSGGTAWSNGQALPLGFITSAKYSSTSPTRGASEGAWTELTCNFTALSGRFYRVNLNCTIGDAANTATVASLRLRDGTTTSDGLLGYASAYTATINSSGFGGTGVHISWLLDSLGAGVHHITPTVQAISGAANLQHVASAITSVMWVEDIGT